MSEIVTDTAPATVDTAPVDNAPTTQTTDTQQVTTPEPTGDGDRAPISGDTNEFSLPDEYKDKSWAEKIKSQDDAYKQIENLTSLVGKKTIAPIDYTTATPEEIAAYHSSLAPEDISVYEFSEEADPDTSKAIGEVFQKYGIDKFQGKGLAEDIRGITSKMIEEKTKADTSEETYMEMMKESFGEDYKQSIGVVEKVLKTHASDDDKKVFDSVDNKTRAAVDRTVHAVSKQYEERIANILKEHGVTETGSQVEGAQGTNTGVDIGAVRSDIRNQLQQIDSRPHTAEEKRTLQNKLAATYK